MLQGYLFDIVVWHDTKLICGNYRPKLAAFEEQNCIDWEFDTNDRRDIRIEKIARVLPQVHTPTV